MIKNRMPKKTKILMKDKIPRMIRQPKVVKGARNNEIKKRPRKVKLKRGIPRRASKKMNTMMKTST